MPQHVKCQAEPSLDSLQAPPVSPLRSRKRVFIRNEQVLGPPGSQQARGSGVEGVQHASRHWPEMVGTCERSAPPHQTEYAQELRHRQCWGCECCNTVPTRVVRSAASKNEKPRRWSDAKICTGDGVQAISQSPVRLELLTGLVLHGRLNMVVPPGFSWLHQTSPPHHDHSRQRLPWPR